MIDCCSLYLTTAYVPLVSMSDGTSLRTPVVVTGIERILAHCLVVGIAGWESDGGSGNGGVLVL